MITIPENTTAFERLKAGGYVCRIVKATEGVNRYKEPCLLLYLDVEEGDFKNYFGKIYRQRLERGFDRYPCVYNQLVNKFSTRHFHRLIETIEQSNAGYFFTGAVGDAWDERELEGLLVGVVLREKEFSNKRGVRRVNLVPCELKTVEEIRRGQFTVPQRARS